MTEHASPPPTPPNDPRQPPMDFVRMETLLTQGNITEMRGAPHWGSNYAALVSIEDGSLEATAVYKPQRGERPLWDFPDGTLCLREVASYLVSQALQWQLVPPTVLRKGPHGMGSVQLFIEHNPDINYFTLDDRFIPLLQRYALFDYLVNNADRKGGHFLLDAEDRLWGIDHGLTFHTTPKLRTVVWEFAGQPVSRDLLAPVQELQQQFSSPQAPLHQTLEKMLSLAEFSALNRRIKQLLDCKTYPTPGPGPNYPWPPI
jgi:hypothetical protein